ncbi:type II secretion system GspH family protein [bacterium]|nr:type II secretion system GspH family protein [bacterium]
MRRRVGFTLIEIMLVMLILSLLTGVAMTRMKAAFDDAALSTDAQRIEKLIQVARKRARLENKIYRISIDQNNSSYTMEHAAAAEGTFKHPSDIDYEYTLSVGVTFAEVRAIRANQTQHESIYAYPDGQYDPLAITLINSAGDTRIID